MQYIFGMSFFLIVALWLSGCTEQAEKYNYTEEALVSYNNSDSEKSTRLEKQEAERLTLAGRREDGLFTVDYQDPGYKDIVVLVKRAQDYLKRNGKMKALEDFMNPDSQFVSGRVYIFVYSTSGECLADWAEPERVGCFIDGEFIAEATDKAEAGGGWIDEVALDPVSGVKAQKESYVLYAANDMILGAGLYKD